VREATMTMDNRDDDLLVDIDQPEMETAAPAKPAAKADGVDPQVVDSLKKQLQAIQAEKEAERQARLQAETDARAMANVAQQAKTSAEASHYQLVEGYTQHAKQRADQIKREIKLALDGGEYERASELQMEAAKVAARQLQYEDAKADMDARLRRREAEPQPDPRRQDRPEPPADPFEASIAGLSEPSKQWLRTHRECVMDDVKQAEVVLADKQARRAGHAPDTTEYFAFIEERMGYRQPQQSAAPEDDASDDEAVVIVDPPKPTARSMPAAPVSRDPTSGRSMPAQVRLSRAEAEMAEHLGMSPKDYWQWKQKAEKDGRYAN